MIFAFLLILAVSSAQDDQGSLEEETEKNNPIVVINQGRLQGKLYQSVLTGNNYYGFFGIPYAKTQSKDNRFKESEQHEGWEGVRDATKIGSDCVQMNPFTKQIEGQEDCLFLNVYTPKVGETELKPVMVFIHGGAFVFGSGNPNVYGADYLINYDVVLVTMNYRLNALGFLNLGIPECPGNVGLKDQVLALKWVQENIKFFGGDENNVTLFGQSAGGGSIRFHMISPLSKGLFKRCIIESANSSLNRKPEEFAFNLGKTLGCTSGSEDKNGLVDCLRKVDAEKIPEAVNNIAHTFDNTTISTPLYTIASLEKDEISAFLPTEPDELSKNVPPVPVMAGLNEKEYTTVLGIKNFTENEITIEQVENELGNNLMQLMGDFRLDTNRIEELKEEVLDFYFGTDSGSDSLYVKVVNLFTDLEFGASMYRSVKYIQEFSIPVYVYQFTFVGELNLLNLLKPEGAENAKYAGHADELSYLLYNPAYGTKIENIKKEPERTVIENMCKLWTNFAKYGNPNSSKDGETVNVEWKPSTVKEPSYVQIGSTVTSMPGRVDETRVTFWESVFEKYKLNATS